MRPNEIENFIKKIKESKVILSQKDFDLIKEYAITNGIITREKNFRFMGIEFSLK